MGLEEAAAARAAAAAATRAEGCVRLARDVAAEHEAKDGDRDGEEGRQEALAEDEEDVIQELDHQTKRHERELAAGRHRDADGWKSRRAGGDG